MLYPSVSGGRPQITPEYPLSFALEFLERVCGLFELGDVVMAVAMNRVAIADLLGWWHCRAASVDREWAS
jgi:hypothetical protein